MVACCHIGPGPIGLRKINLGAKAEAASAARSYRKRVIWSAVTGIVGGACLVGSAVYYVDEVAQHGEDYEPPLGFDFVMLGCLSSVLTSQLLLLSANTYLYDSVNLYNDGIEPAETVPAAGVPFFNERVSSAASAAR